MLSKEFTEILYNQHRSLVIVWVALLISLGIFLFIPDLDFKHLPRPETYPHADDIRKILSVMVLITVAFLLLAKSRLNTVEAIFRGSREPTREKSEKGETPVEKGAARVVSYYCSRMAVSFALAETIAIYGLVLALIGPYKWEQQILSLISGVLLVYFFPSRIFFDDLITEYETREARNESRVFTRIG